jgi:hypothetical protein
MMALLIDPLGCGDRIEFDLQVVVFGPNRALAVWYAGGIMSSSFR